MIKQRNFRGIKKIFVLAAIGGLSYWIFAEFGGVLITKEARPSTDVSRPLALKEVENKAEIFQPAARLNGEAHQPAVNTDLSLADIDMLTAAKNESELRPVLLKFGPKDIMTDLLNDSGGGSLVDCHQESHNIGRLAYEIFGSSAFADGNSSCHSGYYHGAIEAFLHEKGTADLVKNMQVICDNFDTSFGRFECLHGIGHGVLAYENYEMPAAIKICGTLQTGYDQSSCYGGVFMENIVTAQGRGAGQVHETKWADITRPQFPCDSLGDDYDVRYQCYQMQTSWMLTIFNYNFDLVKEECRRAPNDMRSVCFKSFGRDAAGHTLRDVDKITLICGKVFSYADYYQECINGALNVIVDFWGDGLKNQATELCKKVSESGKLNCYQTLSWRLSGVFRSDENRLAVCAGFEEGYRYICVH